MQRFIIKQCRNAISLIDNCRWTRRPHSWLWWLRKPSVGRNTTRNMIRPTRDLNRSRNSTRCARCNPLVQTPRPSVMCSYRPLLPINRRRIKPLILINGARWQVYNNDTLSLQCSTAFPMSIRRCGMLAPPAIPEDARSDGDQAGGV